MLNAHDTQLNLERWYKENFRFWLRQKDVFCEREAYRRSLEWDLIEIYKHNGNCLHEYGKVNGEELDTQTVLDFFKYRCMDLYGKDWENHYIGYKL